MKKILLLVGLIIYTSSAIGQNALDELVEERKQQGVAFTKISNLAEQSIFVRPSSKAFKDQEQFTAFNYTASDQLNSQAIELSFVTKELGQLDVELVNVSDRLESVVLKTDRGVVNDISDTDSYHYRGVIKNMKNSLVAMSFFEEEMMGVISVPGIGDYNIAKGVDDSYHTIVLESNANAEEFICESEVDEDVINQIQEQSDMATNNNPGTRCPSIFFETDFDIYNHFNQDVVAVENFVTGLFNQVSAIYDLEGVTIQLSEIFVWTSQDPYTGTVSENLDTFEQYRTSFDGNLAHLLTYQASSAGGQANIGGLCNPNFSYGITSLFPDFNDYPIYSRQVKVVAHELGHNFGSYHTHRCVWNGDNTTFDDYGNTFPDGTLRNPSEGTISGCIDPNDPSYVPKLSVTPTIMSYYDSYGHGTFPMSNGFGDQPGDVIRNFIANATCVDICSTDCLLVNEITDDVLAGQNVELQAQSRILASNTVESGAIAAYHAGDEVLLVDGFTAIAGAEFYAYIEGCSASGSSNSALPLSNSSGGSDHIIEEVTKSQGSFISPNPVQAYFKIHTNQEIEAIELFNMQGNRVPFSVDGKVVNVSTLAAGMYFIRIQSNSGYSQTLKIIKQ